MCFPHCARQISLWHSFNYVSPPWIYYVTCCFAQPKWVWVVQKMRHLKSGKEQWDTGEVIDWAWCNSSSRLLLTPRQSSLAGQGQGTPSPTSSVPGTWAMLQDKDGCSELSSWYCDESHLVVHYLKHLHTWHENNDSCSAYFTGLFWGPKLIITTKTHFKQSMVLILG